MNVMMMMLKIMMMMMMIIMMMMMTMTMTIIMTVTMTMTIQIMLTMRNTMLFRRLFFRDEVSAVKILPQTQMKNIYRSEIYIYKMTKTELVRY